MTARATLTLARLGASDVVRRYVPWRVVRGVIGAGLAGVFALLVLGAAVVPMPDGAGPGGGEALGFAVFVASFALPLAVLGGAEAVRSAGRTRVLLAAPLGPAERLVVLFLPSLALAAVPVFLLYGPFAVLAARQSAGAAALLLSAGAVAAAWSTVAGVGLVASAASVWGRERGVAAASLAALGLLLGGLPALPFLLRVSLAPSVAAVGLLATLAVIVPVARSVGRRLVEVAGVPPHARSVAPPVWGTLRPWTWVARAHGVAGLAVVAVLFAVVAWGPESPQRALTLGILALTAAGLPAGLAMAAAHARPDLLRAAPAGRRVASRTVARVSLPTILLVVALLAWAGGGDAAWAAGVGALAASFPLTHLLLVPFRRRAAQAAWLLASCILAFL